MKKDKERYKRKNENDKEYEEQRKKHKEDGNISTLILLHKINKKKEKKQKRKSKREKREKHKKKDGFRKKFEKRLNSNQKCYNRKHSATNEITEKDVPKKKLQPIRSFDEMKFPDCVKERLREKFSKPLPIQSWGWPAILQKQDIIGIAKTGSGKTLAYILPALLTVVKKKRHSYKRNKGPIAVVLAPTRELAQQIREVGKEYGSLMGVKTSCIYGGVSKSSQLYDLVQADICVATPGRLIDYIINKDISLDSCKYFVLDEADQLLGMGFEPQIRRIIKSLRSKKKRQTLMFSATLTAKVKILAEDFMQDFVEINLSSPNITANSNIKQIIDVIEESEKHEKLIERLKEIHERGENKTIIFANTKKTVQELSSFLWSEGYQVSSIHSDKTQANRNGVLSDFRKGYISVLVATNIAARGLDVDDIKYVINYDMTNNIEDYVHRIGRSGRVDKKGTAYTFFTFENRNLAEQLIDVLQDSEQHVSGALLTIHEATVGTFGRGHKQREYGTDQWCPNKRRDYKELGLWWEKR